MAEENTLCHFDYFSSFFTSSHRISISIKERSLSDTPRSNAFPSTLRKRCSNLLFALRKASSALHLRWRDKLTVAKNKSPISSSILS